MRKAKRKVNGLSDPENLRKAKAELKQAQKKLKDFIDKVNAEEGTTVLKPDYGKTKVYEGEVKPDNVKVNDKPAPDVPDTEPGAKAVEVTVSEPEKVEGAYTEEPVPKAENVNNQSIDKYQNSDIIESENSNSEIPEEIINDVNKAVDKVAEDFPIIKELPGHLEYGNTGSDLGSNKFETINSQTYAVIKITLSEQYCSDYSLLRQKLEDDYSFGFSYDADNVGSLICHEIGHSLHKLLAMKRAGIKYGDLLDPLKRHLFEDEFKKIQSELYLVSFLDEGYEEILGTIKEELGSMPVDDPYELASQSIGNYYYGKKQSKVAKAIYEYFKKELN